MSDTKRRIKAINDKLNDKVHIHICWISKRKNEDGTFTATSDDATGEIWTITRNTKEELDAAIKERDPDAIQIKWP